MIDNNIEATFEQHLVTAMNNFFQNRTVQPNFLPSTLSSTDRNVENVTAQTNVFSGTSSNVDQVKIIRVCAFLNFMTNFYNLAGIEAKSDCFAA